MKKILAVLALVLFSTMTFAQWSAGPGNLFMLTPGNVGIGTNTPSELLHVKNATGQAGFILDRPLGIPAGNNPVGYFRIVNSGVGSGVYFNFSFRYNQGNSEVVQSAYLASTNTFKAFAFFNVGTGKYEMRGGVADVEFLNTGNVNFNSGGAIGIGMGTTPIPVGSKLAVGGKMICKEVEVTLTNMPDFVFNQDYKLRSLYDVENFINLNKHLPDVPSEKEVIANGLNLGDMNATLLQKVEELTLYMIDLKKENDALKARVSQLEK